MNSHGASRSTAFLWPGRVFAAAVAVGCATAVAGCGGSEKNPISTPAAVNKPIKPTTSASSVAPLALGTKPGKAAPSSKANPSGQAAPSSQANPTSESAQSSWPTLQTVGVPKGKILKKSGPIKVRKNGAVIDGLEVREEIIIEANNVTIRNTRVIGEGEWSIFQRRGFSGLRVENVEVGGDGVHKVQFGILNYGGMLTVKNTYVHTMSNGIGTDQGLIEDSIVMQPKLYPKDHIDLIQTFGGAEKGMSLVIRHNVLLNPIGQTSAVALFQDFGRIHDVTIDNNFLAGGGYSLYGGRGRFGTSSNVKITRNAFSRKYYKNGGQFGPVTAYEKGPGNVWSGNVWAETGKPLLP